MNPYMSEIHEILRLHQQWLDEEVDGVRADFGCYDLSEADLRGVNLHGAYLSGADVSNADFRGADLSGADLTNTDIFAFYAGHYFAWFHQSSAYPEGNWLQIDCQGFSLAVWQRKGHELLRYEDYSLEERKLYMYLINEVLPRIHVVQLKGPPK